MSQPLTPDQVSAAVAAALAALGIEPVASAPVVAAAPKAPETPAWLIERGALKAARRTLAASMRASKAPVTAESWAAAKQAAGITAREKAAHKAFLAAKKAK